MLHYGELKDVLDNYCELGMYEPKSGTSKEIMVLNLFYSEEEAGRDIKQFIEYMPMSIVDVTIRDIMYDNNYKIFVELEITDKLFDNVCRILRDCAGLADIDEWKIKVYRRDEKTITVEKMEKVVGNTVPKLEEPDNDGNDS